MIKVGSIDQLENGGNGLVFDIQLEQIQSKERQGDLDGKVKGEVIEKPQAPSTVPAFAIRFNDEIYVYKNACGHIAINLDFVKGQFFDEEGDHLVCSTHGALYKPDSGKCMGGPCYGVGLEPLEFIVENKVLYITDSTVKAVIES